MGCTTDPTGELAFDVVVVGSGVAGSSAAMTAARSGARVALLEKQDEFGGSAALSAGMFWTAPTLDSYRERVPLGDLGLARRLIDDYQEAVSELRSSGARVADEPQHGVMTFGIGYSTDIRAILAWCRDEVLAAGGQTATGMTVTTLLHGPDGVDGLIARDGDGRRVTYRAGSVILATGGFQGDRAALTRHIGPAADRLKLRSNPGSVGDGLRLATGAGAGGTTAMSTFYGHLLPYPLDRFETEDYLPASQYYSGEALLVNLRGQRFADERQGDELLNQSLTFQPDSRGVLIFDDEVRRTGAMDESFPGLGRLDRVQWAIDAGGRYASAPTVDELVRQVAGWGIDGERLQTTVDRYAHSSENGGGVVDGVPVAAGSRPPRCGPFHALMVQPSITFTFGGVRTNDQGEALDFDGRPLPGLYAAGADIGGLSNYGYVGGLAPGYITGRWAGKSAALAALAAHLPAAVR